MKALIARNIYGSEAYYMVYLKDNGELIYNHLEGKKILDILRMLCKGKNEPLIDVCKAFNAETNDCREMDNYSELLQKSIGSIMQSEEEKEVTSLFSSGGTTVMREKVKGIEDFKLISFIVVK